MRESINIWNPWWADKGLIKELTKLKRESVCELAKSIKLRHVKDILGLRRAGKTTLIYQLIEHLLDKGIDAKNLLYLNLEDPVFVDKSIEEILSQVEIVNPQIKYLFLDEIQQIDGWERGIRKIYDLNKFKQIFISGSSASLISRDIGNLLTGRHLTKIIFPFSFREYLASEGVINLKLDSLYLIKNKVLFHLSRFLEVGGMPETIGLEEIERKEVLIHVYQDILLRDIIGRFNLDFEILSKIANYLVSNFCNEFSYRKMASNLGLHYDTIKRYVPLLKESFLIYELPLFDYKLKIQYKQNKKIYCIDNGLRNAVSFKFSRDEGKLAENLVFVELKRRKKEVYYWKNQKQQEVDFIIKNRDQSLNAINVSYTNDIDEREIKGLIEFKSMFKKCKNLVILTKDLEKEEVIGKRKIKFIPLWKWLLHEEPALQ